MPEIASALHDFIRHKRAAMGVVVHAVNGVPDHIHLACTLPLTFAPSDFLEKIKGGSAHFINHKPEWQRNTQIYLRWQSGTGVLTFTRRDLPRIVAYIDSQKHHHECGHLWPNMERTDDGYDAQKMSR